MEPIQPTSFRLSADASQFLNQLGDWLGLKRSAVVEQAIRRMYAEESWKFSGKIPEVRSKPPVNRAKINSKKA